MFKIFDVNYRQQQKKIEKYNNLKADFMRALKLLKLVEKRLKDQGMPRWKVRQFFRDFFKDGEVRKEVFDQLMKALQ